MASNTLDRAKYAVSIPGRANIMFHNAKRRANCTITREWIENKLNLGVCEITGISFDLEPTLEFDSNPYAPSLDKINPKQKEYTPENTRVVLTAVNKALNEYGEKAMLPILKAMIKSIERN